jgi:hypothetical protein
MKFLISCTLLLSVIILAGAINPLVFFPGYSFCNLHVQVINACEPGCPHNGNFTVGFGMAPVQNGFDVVCMYKFLNLAYDPLLPQGRRFINHPHTNITIPGYTTGNVDLNVNAAYNDFINALVGAGLVKGQTLRSACYDFRMASNEDAIVGSSFMQNTQNIIQAAYASAGNKRVYLVGHSNGGKGMLYFLSQQSQAWKNQYIAGMIGSAGNWPGQASLIPVFLLGLNVVDFSFNPALAENQAFWTSNYFTMAQPSVFSGSNSEITFQTNYVTISTNSHDYDVFFVATRNLFGRLNWRNYINLAGPGLTPPGVRSWAFRGTGISGTLIGVQTPSFTNLTILNYITTDGDINQEDATNFSSDVWNTLLPQGCYTAVTYPGVTHFELTTYSGFISSVLNIISTDVVKNCAPLGSQPDPI